MPVGQELFTEAANWYFSAEHLAYIENISFFLVLFCGICFAAYILVALIIFIKSIVDKNWDWDDHFGITMFLIIGGFISIFTLVFTIAGINDLIWIQNDPDGFLLNSWYNKLDQIWSR